MCVEMYFFESLRFPQNVWDMQVKFGEAICNARQLK